MNLILIQHITRQFTEKLFKEAQLRLSSLLLCATVLLFIEASASKHLQVLSGRDHRDHVKEPFFMYICQATEE